VDFKKEIGRRIKEARREKGWTLVELARQTRDALSDTRIGNYETGERMPRPSEAVILGSALGKRPAYLMGLDDGQLVLTPLEEGLIRNWRKLPENERMGVFRRVEQLAMAFRDAVPDSRVERAFSPDGKRKQAASAERRATK
jgi:transcriptional regulator with XRE-family HTH domain